MLSATRAATVLVVVLAVFSIAGFSQTSSVDLSFAPVPSLKFDSNDATSKGIVAQPDGKVLIWGGSLVADGVAKGEVARLNVNGSLDSTFNYCGCLLATLSNVAVQSDGKILLAGRFNSHAKIVRLNSDGSQDPSFASAFTNDGNALSSFAAVDTIQPDGKILVRLSQGFDIGFHSGVVFRLNPDGSADTGFTAIAYDGGRSVFGSLTALVLDPAGKIYVAITTSSGGSTSSILRRHNSDGTQDATWMQPAFTDMSGIPPRFNGLAVQADGGLLISGRFDTVNCLPKQNVVRILPAGNVDMAFTAPILGNTAGQLKILPTEKILVAYSITGNGLITRLNADGSADPTFVLSPTVSIVVSPFILDPAGKILFFGLSDSLKYLYFRLNVNGDVDSSFVPNVTKPGTVRSMALQSDGKMIVAGNFTQLNGVGRISIGRINANGSIDTVFDPGDGFNSAPLRLVVQADGKIIAAGGFTQFNGAEFPGLLRLNSEGTIDFGFAPNITGSVATASVQSDGQILIGGIFTAVDSIARTSVARLSAAGTLDSVFNPIIGNPSITEIFQQGDGKIMVGGAFSGVNGFNRTSMVRLNDDGSLDQTFDSTGVGGVARIYLQADGKYVVTGGAGIKRRTAAGAADNGFVPPQFTNDGNNFSASIDTVLVQPDGTLIVGGSFATTSGSRRNLVRLTSNGTLDQLFFQGGADGAVRSAVRQADGKVVIGGEFTKVDNVTRAALARLSIAVFHAVAPFDFDGDGHADISVVRPSTNRWYEVFSSTGAVYEETFGLAGDIVAPADFDGDGITDEAIYRPSNSQWWFRSSLNGSLVLNQFGGATDIPRPSDFDGDGKADLVLYRAGGLWSRFSSLTHQATSTTFGLPGDQPLVGDFDGDGKGDLAVFRPSNGDWWYAASSLGGAFRNVHWGQNGDIPVPADYDGDGKTDEAVYRPSEGGWYIYNSSNGSFTTVAFGLSGDRPVAADYDGDGKADIAVFRPSTGIWYLLRSTAGFAGYQFGISTDIAIPGSLIP